MGLMLDTPAETATVPRLRSCTASNTSGGRSPHVAGRTRARTRACPSLGCCSRWLALPLSFGGGLNSRKPRAVRPGPLPQCSIRRRRRLLAAETARSDWRAADFLAMSAMVEEEQAATEVRELRVVLDRGRRGDDLRISRSLTDGAVGAGIGAGWFSQRGGCGGDRCPRSCRQQHRW